MRARCLLALLAAAAAAAAAAATAAAADECAGDGSVAGAPDDRDAAEWEALVGLYNATQGDVQWLRKACWASEPRRVCNLQAGGASAWHGVECEQGRVVKLDLTNNGLVTLADGLSIPTDWSGAPALRSLKLGANIIRAMPARWNAPSLEEITLESAQVVGTLHAAWEGLDALQTLVLSFNGNLAGALPPLMTGLPSLTGLDLSHTGLGGTLSGDWSASPALQRVLLQNTLVSGSLPAVWHADSLEKLEISRAHLTGELPHRWEGLPRLGLLDLSVNKLRGEFDPSVWSGLPALKTLKLAQNQLSGSAPSDFAGMPQIENLGLAINGLEGRVPNELRHADSLTWYDLHGNALSELNSTMTGAGSLKRYDLSLNAISGTFPAVWRGVPALGTLDLATNQLSGEFPARVEGLASLTGLFLSRNRLAGPLPARSSGYESVRFLKLDDNKLDSTLPSRWTGWPALEALSVQSNRLSGEMPRAFEGLSSVLKLEVDHNWLSGAVPLPLGGLVRLVSLSAAANKLSGRLDGGRWGASPPGGGPSLLHTVTLSDNPISGTVGPRLLPGAPRLGNLQLRSCRLSGELPAALTEPANLTLLELSQNRISGTFPAGALEGYGRLKTLAVADNLVSGALPGANTTGLGALTELDASVNRISGALVLGAANFAPGPLPQLKRLDVSNNLLSGRPTVYLQAAVHLHKLDISFNRFSGTLPGELLGLTFVDYLDVTSNNFTALELPVPPVGILPSARLLRLSSNGIAAIPPWFCQHFVSGQLESLQLDGNELREAPACLSEIRGLVALDLSNNRIGRLPFGFGLSATATLRSLDLSGNRLRAIGLFQLPDGNGETPSGSRLVRLDVSRNPLHTDVNVLLARWQHAFPLLTSLKIAETSLINAFASVIPANLVHLDVSGNTAFSSFGHKAEIVTLQELDVSNTSFAEDSEQAVTSLVSYSRADVPLSSCVPEKLLRSERVTVVDVRGSSSHGCTQRMYLALHPSSNERRFFKEARLLCPTWLTRASGARVLADAPFLDYAECYCTGGLRWDAAEEACVPCRAGGEDELGSRWRCDPYVVAPRPCVLGNHYPAERGTARLLRDAASLQHEDRRVLLTCRLPGQCNAGAARCDSRDNKDEEHSVDALEKAPPELEFRCGDGYDPDALLCSRCLEDHWRSGSACLECRTSFVWLVPLSLTVLVVLLLLMVTRGARPGGSSARGYRTLSTVFLWFQLTQLLEASSQAQAGNESNSTWPWLAHTQSAVASWAVFRPWAVQCVVGRRYDFVTESTVLLAAPLVLALFALAAWRARLGVVLYTCVWFLLNSLFLPAATAAFQSFGCETAGGFSFLSAAPYERCDVGSSQLVAFRAMAGVSLAAYVVPTVVLSVVFLRKARVQPAAPERPGAAASLNQPLLDSDDEADVEQRAVAAAVGVAPGDGGGDDSDGGSSDGNLSDDGLALVSTVGGRGLHGHRGAGRGRRDRKALLHEVAYAVMLRSLAHPAKLWWWPVAYVQGRSLALAMVVGLVPVSSALLPILVFVVLAAATLLHVWYTPWRHASDNKAETVVLLGALAMYLMNIVGGAARAHDAAAHSSLDSSATRAAISLISLVIHTYLFYSLAVRFRLLSCVTRARLLRSRKF